MRQRSSLLQTPAVLTDVVNLNVGLTTITDDPVVVVLSHTTTMQLLHSGATSSARTWHTGPGCPPHCCQTRSMTSMGCGLGAQQSAMDGQCSLTRVR